MAMIGFAEEPTTARQDLIARLERPETVESLNKLLDRLDLMVFAVDAADELLHRSETIVDSVSDSVSELRSIPVSSDARQLVEKLPRLTHAGLQAAELAANPAFGRLLSSGLIERLGDEKTIHSLHSLLDHLDLAAFALSSLNEFLERSEIIADSVADSVQEAKKAAPNLDFASFNLARIKEAATALPALLDVAVEIKRSGILDHTRSLLETLNQLQAARILSSDTVAVVGGLGAAATSTHNKKEFAQFAPKGVFGLLGALKDPDVQATLGFALAFAHDYGRALRAEAT